MIKNYMVAVCDILGFSRYVENKNNNVGDIVNISLDFFQKTLSHAINKKEFPKERPSLQELKNQSRLAINWFSDTVLLYTLNDEDEDCRQLINTVAWLLFENIYSPNTRIRAGISYGECYMDADNAIYVGKPIVEAYNLERNQQWSGAGLTDEAVKRIPEYALNGSRFDWNLIQYKIPLKTNQINSIYAVDWTIGDHRKFNLEYSKDPSESKEDKDIIEKWKNTVKFHNDVCFWCGHNKNQKIKSVL